MDSALFRLKTHDWIKGAVMAILAALITYLAGVMNIPGWDFSSIDWVYIFKIALTAFISYLGKNFLTAENGKILGKI